MKRYFIILTCIGILTGSMAVYKSIFNHHSHAKINRPKEKLKAQKIKKLPKITNEKALSVSKDFLKSYLTYHKKNPYAYLKAIKPYSTKEFLDSESESPKREEVYIKTVDPTSFNISVTRSVNSPSVSYKYNLTVFAQVKKSVTNVNKHSSIETTTYWLKLNKVHNEWLVNEVYADGNTN